MEEKKLEIKENVDNKKTKNATRSCNQSINTKAPKGITLVALVVTIIIIIILSTIAINFTFGENGLITRAEQAKELAEVSTIQEQMEMIKADEYIEGQGTIDPDRYFDKLEDAGVIVDKDTDVVDNGDGTYEVTADPDYVFEVTLKPDKENPTDLEIEYVGRGENDRPEEPDEPVEPEVGPEISEIKIVSQTDSSISVEIDVKNAEGATYTYSYRKEGAQDWIDVTNSSNTYVYEGLEASTTYEIKVKVETAEGSSEKETKVTLGAPEVAPERTITFGETTWSGYKASITVNTSAEGYTIEYQVNKQDEGQWQTVENNGTIPNLNHGDTVYARITDGSKTSGTQEKEILDEKNPTVVVNANGTTSSSVSVTVQAVDNESGMKENSTYTYSIKESGQGDETYTTPENANGIANTSYTFTGLTQGTNYTVRVQVNGDKANNVGTGTLTEQITGTVGGASEGLQTGNIVATNPTWSNGTASITLTTSVSGMQIEWQKNVITGSWTKIDSGEQVTGLSHGDTVFARLTDGINVGDYSSVTISDGTPPSITNITTSNITANSVTVTVTASDGQSGLATSGTYKYYLNNEGSPRETNTTGSYTFTELNAGTSYTIKVVVTDKAGNEAEDTRSVMTIALPSIEGTLEEGDYVFYEDGKGIKRKCVVLYDSSSRYGVEIITMESVKDIKLGNGTGSMQTNNTTFFNTAMNSYNNAISTLNSAASDYNNTTYSSRARCVGSVPNNPTSEATIYYTSIFSYMEDYNGQFKNEDTNYEIDWNKMNSLTIHDIDKDYWLASRIVYSQSNYSGFDVRYVDTDGKMFGNGLCRVGRRGDADSYNPANGLRPIFLLRSNIKVTGGTGEERDPYTLGT